MFLEPVGQVLRERDEPRRPFDGLLWRLQPCRAKARAAPLRHPNLDQPGAEAARQGRAAPPRPGHRESIH